MTSPTKANAAAPRASTSSALVLPPPIIASAGDLLNRYDVLFSDVWGVIHDGHKAFPAAAEALVRFRDKGGTVILVSNAPVPKDRVARMLDFRAVPREVWDDIVSSGGIALDHIAQQGYDDVHYIGPRDRDAAFFNAASARPVEMRDAQAIVCTGLEDDGSETAEDYRGRLEKAREFGLPFVCANPDLVVDVGGRLYPCAGQLAELYERLGGAVFWAGKPHPSAYDSAHRSAERIRGETIDRSRILAIGDALRTDLAAAHGAGIDALFIASGIHRADTMENGQLDVTKLERLFAPGGTPALAAMSYLRW